MSYPLEFQMTPDPEGGAPLWGEGPAENEMPNVENDGRGENSEILLE